MKFTVEKNNNYTVMSNYHLRDKNLSYKAKGLLSFMLSLPDDWDYSIRGLVAVSKEQSDAIRSGLKELEENKYLKRESIKDDKGRFTYEYFVYEHPYRDFPYTDIPYADNQTEINTNKIITNKQDKIDKIHSLTQILINKNFINIDDFELENYNNLFENSLKNYEYKEIIIVIDYIIKHWNSTKGLDEFENLIIKKFNYFKESLNNNLNKLEKIREIELY